MRMPRAVGPLIHMPNKAPLGWRFARSIPRQPRRVNASNVEPAAAGISFRVPHPRSRTGEVGDNPSAQSETGVQRAERDRRTVFGAVRRVADRGGASVYRARVPPYTVGVRELEAQAFGSLSILRRVFDGVCLDHHLRRRFRVLRRRLFPIRSAGPRRVSPASGSVCGFASHGLPRGTKGLDEWSRIGRYA
jgi:hypothetical protein